MFAALVLCRWAHYSAALLIFGASSFVWLLAPPGLSVRLTPPFRAYATGAAGIVVATMVAWLVLEAGTMGDGWPDTVRPDTIVAVLFDTDFGRAWQVHGAASVLLAIAVASGRPSVVCPVAALVLASLGFVGHALIQSAGIGWLLRANLALHLLAAGFWLGGLWPLLATMRLADDPDLRVQAIEALRRFSTLGHVVVAAVVVTGIANTSLISGESIFETGSAYTGLLALKVAVVAMMIVLALINRYWLVPHLRSRPDNARSILRNSVIEIGLGGLAVGLVSVFGLLDPHG